MKYASRTEVSDERSQTEIKKVIQRYGATRFATLEEPGRVAILFEVQERRVKFVLPLPTIEDFACRSNGARRPTGGARAAYEQAIRQRWRALALAIKAKLEIVESNIATFEEEFLAHVVLPNGQTVSEMIVPQLETAYKSGKMPPLLLGAGEPSTDSNVVEADFRTGRGNR